jgi:hypothetical protein
MLRGDAKVVAIISAKSHTKMVINRSSIPFNLNLYWYILSRQANTMFCLGNLAFIVPLSHC